MRKDQRSMKQITFSDSLTNPHNYNSGIVYHQGKEHIIEKTNTFSSQPYSSTSHSDIHKKSSPDRLDERNVCTNIGNSVVQRDTQTIAYRSVSKNHIHNTYRPKIEKWGSRQRCEFEPQLY